MKDVVFASLENLKKIVENRQYMSFVWPEEGEFDREGNWEFNDRHEEFEPLLVDMTSANTLVTVYDMLSVDTTKEKFASFISTSRGHFGYIFEHTMAIVTKRSA